MRFFSLLTRAGRSKRRHDKIVSAYRDYAIGLGDGLSYAYMGEPIWHHRGRDIGIVEQYHILDEHEEKYAELGYRIIPLQRWVGHGGYGESIDDVWLVARERDERPVFTKDVETPPEFPAVSPMIALMEANPGKAVEGFQNEDGDLEFKVVDDE